MRNYSRSVSIATTALMLDKNLNIETKQEVIRDLMEIEEKFLEQEENSELVWPEGTGE